MHHASPMKLSMPMALSFARGHPCTLFPMQRVETGRSPTAALVPPVQSSTVLRRWLRQECGPLWRSDGTEA